MAGKKGKGGRRPETGRRRSPVTTGLRSSGGHRPRVTRQSSAAATPVRRRSPATPMPQASGVTDSSPSGHSHIVADRLRLFGPDLSEEGKADKYEDGRLPQMVIDCLRESTMPQKQAIAERIETIDSTSSRGRGQYLSFIASFFERYQVNYPAWMDELADVNAFMERTEEVAAAFGLDASSGTSTDSDTSDGSERHHKYDEMFSDINRTLKELREHVFAADTRSGQGSSSESSSGHGEAPRANPSTEGQSGSVPNPTLSGAPTGADRLLGHPVQQPIPPVHRHVPILTSGQEPGNAGTAFNANASSWNNVPLGPNQGAPCMLPGRHNGHMAGFLSQPLNAYQMQGDPAPNVERAPPLPTYQIGEDWVEFMSELTEYMFQTQSGPQRMMATKLRQCFKGPAKDWFNIKRGEWVTWGDFLNAGDEAHGQQSGSDRDARKLRQKADTKCHEYVWEKYGLIQRYTPQLTERQKIAAILETAQSYFQNASQGMRMQSIDDLAFLARSVDINRDWQSHPDKGPSTKRTDFKKTFRFVAKGQPKGGSHLEKSSQPASKPDEKGTSAVLKCYRCDGTGHRWRDCKGRATQRWIDRRRNLQAKMANATTNHFSDSEEEKDMNELMLIEVLTLRDSNESDDEVIDTVGHRDHETLLGSDPEESLNS